MCPIGNTRLGGPKWCKDVKVYSYTDMGHGVWSLLRTVVHVRMGRGTHESVDVRDICPGLNDLHIKNRSAQKVRTQR